MENETDSSETPESKNIMPKQFVAAISLGLVVSLIMAAIGLALSVDGQVIASNNIVSVTGNAGSLTGNVKEFILSISNGNYQPNPITVNKGDTVRLVADLNSVRGCYRTVFIPKFNVRKTVSESDRAIEFVASVAGTFRITCGMGMAGGLIAVKDANGSVPATTDISGQAKHGTCGSSGGCGFGGR